MIEKVKEAEESKILAREPVNLENLHFPFPLFPLLLCLLLLPPSGPKERYLSNSLERIEGLLSYLRTPPL
jgi:hypothetical protein